MAAAQAGDLRGIARAHKAGAALDFRDPMEHFGQTAASSSGTGSEARGAPYWPTRSRPGSRAWTCAPSPNAISSSISSGWAAAGGSTRYRAPSMCIIGASWGSGPSIRLARWFWKRYGFKPRLHILIEGANLLGLPVRAIGPAEEDIAALAAEKLRR